MHHGHRARSHFAESPVLTVDVSLLRDIGHLHRHAQLATQLRGESHVLCGEIQLESRLESALEYPVGKPCMEVVLPELCDTASYKICASTPHLTPRVNASESSTPTLSPIRLLTILETAPDPSPPQYITLSPMRSSTGLY